MGNSRLFPDNITLYRQAGTVAGKSLYERIVLCGVRLTVKKSFRKRDCENFSEAVLYIPMRLVSEYGENFKVSCGDFFTDRISDKADPGEYSFRISSVDYQTDGSSRLRHIKVTGH